MYVQRVVVYPQIEKIAEMRQHLESFMNTRQGQGPKTGLSMQMFGESPAFVVTIRLNDLSELEQLRERNRTDQAFRDYQAKLFALSRIPPRIELLEVIVPIPN
jgi:hypothetical protein